MMGRRTRVSLARAGIVACCVAGCGLAGCVEGAPKDRLGQTTFTASANGIGTGSAFAPPAQPTGAAGESSATGPVNEPMGEAGSAAPPPPMAAGASAAGMSGGPVSSGNAGMNAIVPRGGAGGAAGSGAAGMGSAGSASPTGPSAGTLTITFTSVNQGGRYQPRNVGAVWIETGSGMFVKTIERWAGIRANHLTRWAQASGGWGSFFGGGNTADKMDAISRATLARHEKHMLTWDMKDLMNQTVPDGKYKVGIEVTEDNFVPGANVLIEFEKGPAPVTVMPPDQKPYSGLVISYQP